VIRHSPATGTDVSERVLFVCTANICRSPMAQRLFEARLPDDVHIDAASAGIRALTGHAMDAPSATVLRELGGDPAGHVAVQLTPTLVDDAALILTATSEHRADILREQPGAMRHTYTLREFARLGAGVAHDPDRSLRETVLQVAAQRGLGVAEPGADEIGDPFGASLAVVRHCGQQISDAVDAVLRVLGGQRGDG
jgi:protein-tyrosine phosphatase